MTATIDTVRGRWREAKTTRYAQRFLDKPYASVQLIVLASAGLLFFGILMASPPPSPRPRTPTAAARSGAGHSRRGSSSRSASSCSCSSRGCRPGPIASSSTRCSAWPSSACAPCSCRASGPRSTARTAGSTSDHCRSSRRRSPSWRCCCGARTCWPASSNSARSSAPGTWFVPLLPGFVFVVALVMLEPDLGTTCCFMLILLGLLWMVGMPMRYFVAVLVMIGGAITLLAITAPYRLERLTTFTDPFRYKETSGYHAVEGLYALASGGIFGVGLGREPRSTGGCPTPTPTTCSRSSVRNSALIGCLAVLILFGLFAFAGIRIVGRSTDPFARLIAGAATIWLCGQARHQHRLRHRAAAGHRDPAATDLGRRHVVWW